MKVFIALCILFVISARSSGAPAEALEVEEENIVENELEDALIAKFAEEMFSESMNEALVGEMRKDLVLAALDSLHESQTAREDMERTPRCKFANGCYGK